MKRRSFSFLVAAGLATLAGGNAFSAPKIYWEEAVLESKGGTAQQIAEEYLQANAERFDLPKDLAGLKFEKTKQSLLGTHVYFQQFVEGIAVDDAQVIVSLNDSKSKVYRVFDSVKRVQAVAQAKARILTKDRAYDLAWNNLRVRSPLASEPKIKLLYKHDGKALRLIYRTYLRVEAPFGAWEHEIDAHTGKVLSVKDTRLERKKATTIPPVVAGPVLDRREAFAEFFSKKQQKSRRQDGEVVNGSGVVFDPDPRTTLNSNDLGDESDEALFTDAYLTRDLLDISLNDGVYSLNGAWVKIGDFESPANAPSTTTDGQWTAKRGTNAFNDAMTYFHVDQNQRYMQSLGFTGDKAIQGGPIEVDTDGVNGADNSHFIPSENKMAFGHGCVDDNEDADVILHEYGHAINHSINDHWSGGDTGAMGEGFGDYWAGSYSVSTPNGRVFNPNKVFTWDGDPCWSGRNLDAKTLRYDHNRNYSAHASLGTGVTDELWSTPLFQALLALLDQGVARSEVDKIILEAQFGLGGSLKMRDMANAIVLTARALFPDGPHGDVFKAKFLAQGIVDVPVAVLAQTAVSITTEGANGFVDPGETAGLVVAVKNNGTEIAQSIAATLTSLTPGVTVSSGVSAYPDLETGASASNATPFTVAVATDVACGSKLKLNLHVTHANGATPAIDLPLEIPTGVAQGAVVAASPDAIIPDDDGVGLESIITIDSPGALVSENISIDVEISHTYVDDLEIALVSPSGKRVVLRSRTGGAVENVVGNYPKTLTPEEPLTSLAGESLSGQWTLAVRDLSPEDQGKLVKWAINDVTGYVCE